MPDQKDKDKKGSGDKTSGSKGSSSKDLGYDSGYEADTDEKKKGKAYKEFPCPISGLSFCMKCARHEHY